MVQASTRFIRGIESVGEPIAVAAFGRQCLALATSTTLQVVELVDNVATPIYAVPLPHRPSTVGISDSGSYVLAVEPDRIRVWSRGASSAVFERPLDSAGASVGAIFARLDEREVLLYEPEQAQLEAYDLASGERLFQGSTETFLPATAISVAGGTAITLVGHFRGEGKDSLAVIPMVEFASPTDVLFTRFRKKRAIADYAYRLAAGRCGVDAIVVFRDPEDDEEPDEDDDEPVTDTSAHADVRGLQGFYVRRLDGTLIAKRSWNGPIKSHAPLAATSSWIAASCVEQIALVPVAPELPATSVPARWLAASPDGSRILASHANGGLLIVDLESSESA